MHLVCVLPMCFLGKSCPGTNAILATTSLNQLCRNENTFVIAISGRREPTRVRGGYKLSRPTVLGSGYLSGEPRDGAVSSQSDALRFLSYLYSGLINDHVAQWQNQDTVYTYSSQHK